MRYLLLLAVAVAAHGQFGAATSVVSGNGAPVAAQCTNANNVGRVWARKDGGAASTTFYICAATGAGTYGWQLNDGAIGGAGNIASGQVLYGTAAGVAGSEANLFWDAANDRLGVGTNAPQKPFHIRAAGGLRVDTASSGFDFTNSNTGEWQVTAVNSILRFGILGSLWAHATGNVTVGTTTDDGTNRLQVAGSGFFSSTTRVGSVINGGIVLVPGGTTGTGYLTWQMPTTDARAAYIGFASAGGQQLPLYVENLTAGFSIFQTTTSATSVQNWYRDANLLMDLSASGVLTLRNSTPTTGVTQFVVRAGAGQSSTNLVTIQNASAVSLLTVDRFGLVSAADSFVVSNKSKVSISGFELASDALLLMSSTTGAGGAKDLSLSRAGVNIGQVGDGGSNSNGLLYLKGVRPVGSTVANLPAAAGNTGMLATVTDANATTIGTTVAGGGSDTVLVWSNGTNWRIYAN
jgi:hypothetical protein